ncbi:agmatine deiminase family protein [Craterilacuibacter sinensis]|uniref:Agmatine deiminase family protein n=1 Tax=Craterilacuibacter sinensis TaxID=2686017 RepID=A0A845BQV1_9NEIS|nr:agmatine deiminase family protein [Craterilacuibacter sinensis]MXR36841.1 agmatine deiminase family protein [Craterilacuibacter sinensis]
MLKRREFLQRGLRIGGALALTPLASGCLGGAGGETDSTDSWRMPDESAPHRATWMAFGASDAIWGPQLLSPCRDALALIANTIVRYEPVKMLVRQSELAIARQLLNPKVELLSQPLDDLWIRDTGPVFVKNRQGKLAGVDFNFNGWGNKQAYAQDAEVAEFVCAQAGTPVLHSKLVLEGGGIEVDGEGTAIMTESCVLNRNRNPGVSKADCEAELKRLLGIRKIIWLPGIAGRDITDGHTDFYARFAGPGVVVAGLEMDPDSFDYAVTRAHLKILRAATNAQGRKLRVVEMQGPNSIRPRFDNSEFAAGYINFYVCNGAVIAPQFGDITADNNARDTLRELFPGRDVIQLDIDAIAAGGGGIHCTTQQQPA